ncbi:MAG: hypothetical protein LC114_05905 [Bryobacterales bacterium]|nr:hypothetical protein [Bryobacterales bacterium]
MTDEVPPPDSTAEPSHADTTYSGLDAVPQATPATTEEIVVAPASIASDIQAVRPGSVAFPPSVWPDQIRPYLPYKKGKLIWQCTVSDDSSFEKAKRAKQTSWPKPKIGIRDTIGFEQ